MWNTDTAKLRLGDITVNVVRKDIKNVHLSVYPPNGVVRMAAPARMDLETLRVFAVSKLSWIKNQRRKVQEQERETPRDYIERESHYVWGKRYLLRIVERDAAALVKLTTSRLILQVRPGTGREKRREILDFWYREQIRGAVPALIAKWARLMRVSAPRVIVQSMKTKWGSCSSSGNIRLNTELAKKPPEHLEYILVHEMAHLIAPTHNDRFTQIMDQRMPQWRSRRTALNRLPIRAT
jgi:predicted metal-dependent hydrolase